MTLRELTRPLRRGLSRLRHRARWLLSILGVSRLLSFSVGALLLFFLADFLLRLPMPVRQVLLLLIVAGTVVVFVRRLLRPLSTRLDDDTLAARVESAYPELENRFSSSLAFARAVDDPDNEDSPDLMRAVVEQTVGMVGGIRFTRVARSRTAILWGVLASGLLLVATIGSALQPELASTFFARSVLLRDISWPRRTTLSVTDMVPGVVRRVTRGRDVTVEVRATGSIPGRVAFRYWERRTGRGSVETIELTPSAEDQALFAITLPVYASYEFTVTGGDDDRAEVYSIEALTPPALLAIEMDCTYPAYLERPTETLRGGDQRLPEGTDVVLRIRANMDLERATISFLDKEPRALKRIDPQLFSTELKVDSDLRYSIRLAGLNGEENDPGVDTYVLRMHKDQAPRLRVHTPGPRCDRLPAGLVLIAFSVQDDHRVESARLLYTIGDGKERALAPGAPAVEGLRMREAPFVATDDALRALAVIDAARLRRDDGKALARGDRIRFQVEASDSAGHVQRTSRSFSIHFFSDEDLAQELQGRQQRLHESLDRTADRAEAAVSEMEAVRDARGDPDEFRRATGRARAAQARVISDLDGLFSRIREIFNDYVFNRLTDPAAVDQILPFIERHLLEPTDRMEVPFRGSLYRTLWTAQQERSLRAAGSLSKLMEMADLSDRLAADYAPSAYRALSRASTTGDAAEIGEALNEAAREQLRVTEGLKRLRQLMREWRTFEDVVRFFKIARDREQGLVDELRPLDKGGQR